MTRHLKRWGPMRANRFVLQVCYAMKLDARYGGPRACSKRRQHRPRRGSSRRSASSMFAPRKITHSSPNYSDRNWLEFLSVLDGTFAVIRNGSEASESAKTECSKAITETHKLFSRLAEQDGLKDRSGLLGLLELEKRARSHGLSRGLSKSDLKGIVYRC